MLLLQKKREYLCTFCAEVGDEKVINIASKCYHGIKNSF